MCVYIHSFTYKSSKKNEPSTEEMKIVYIQNNGIGSGHIVLSLFSFSLLENRYKQKGSLSQHIMLWGGFILLGTDAQKESSFFNIPSIIGSWAVSLTTTIFTISCKMTYNNVSYLFLYILFS